MFIEQGDCRQLTLRRGGCRRGVALWRRQADLWPGSCRAEVCRGTPAELKGSLESGKQDWGAMEKRRHLVMVVGDQVLPAAPGVRDRGLSRRS